MQIPARLRSFWPLALAVVTLAALIVRIAAIAEPLGIDQGLWASAVRGMSRGQLLYRDVWEQRPPGIYFTYLAGFNLFGWTPAAVAWLDVIASAATTLLLFLIVRRLSTPTTGALAAALFATLTMPAWLYSYGGFLERSNCETFITVCVGLATWCAVRWRESRSVGWAAGVGLFIGAAVVYKPNAGLYLPAILLWMALYRRHDNGTVARPILAPVTVAVLASAVLPVLTILWLWRLDLLHEAKIAVVDFNRFYLGQGFSIAQYAYDFSRDVNRRFETDPLWLGGGIGSVVAVWQLVRTRRIDPLGGLAILWGAASAGVIVVNGARLFNSYFMNALPPLAVLTAWLLAHALRGSRLRPIVVVGTAIWMLSLLVQRNYPARVMHWATADFAQLRGRGESNAYLERFGGYATNRGYSARANLELAEYISNHTSPDDRVFLFGINAAGVYFTSDRLAAHRFLRVNFFVPTTFPDPEFELDAVLRDLAARQPRYLIFEQLHSTSEMARTVDALQANAGVQQLLENYQLEVRIEDFTLYRRK